MYRQFCKNLNHFIQLNQAEGASDNLRLQNAYCILPLTAIKDYLGYKSNNSSQYFEISNLIFLFTAYQEQYPRLKKFLWELWAVGFDAIPSEESEHLSDKNFMQKVKLLDLMLSTHYF